MFDLFIYNLVGEFKNALISKRHWKLVMFDNKVKYFKIRAFLLASINLRRVAFKPALEIATFSISST